MVLADGFPDEGLPRYVDVVRAVRRELLGTAPFSTLRALVSMCRIDRTGPSDLGVTFGLTDERLVRLDEERARRVASEYGAAPDVVLVVVDSPRYAGYGGAGIAAVTVHPDAPRLALHEIAHAGFDLADEYGGDGPAASGDGEPHRVNVSRVGDPSLVKWRDLVTSDGTVGCFEGGDRTSYGMFRPSPRCLMRSVHDDFCPVCRREIARQLVFLAQGRSPT